MKRPTKQLLDDLVEDSASPEFRAALMDKTLRSAWQRKQRRHFKLVLAMTATAGIIAFAFLKTRVPTTAQDHPGQSESRVANSPKPDSVEIVSAKQNPAEDMVSPASCPVLTIVQTTASARPKEIDDKQLLALLSDRPAALVYHGAHKAELIFFSSEGEVSPAR
jgi:hypothetical protein